MRERRGPDCLSQSVVVATATTRLLAGPTRPWHEIQASYARAATIRGGGRVWTLRCRVRLDGSEGGRFNASVDIWSGDPEEMQSREFTSTPRLLEFFARIQRRLRGAGFTGRFRTEKGDNWIGLFSRRCRGLANLERVLASLDRLERSTGAVARRADLRTECLAWGELQPGTSEHQDCPVVVARARKGTPPALCACECLTCQRAWWDRDRPTQRGKKLVTASGKVIA